MSYSNCKRFAVQSFQKTHARARVRGIPAPSNISHQGFPSNVAFPKDHQDELAKSEKDYLDQLEKQREDLHKQHQGPSRAFAV